jgi:hypothetical protein
LLAIPNTFWANFRGVPNRFWGCSRQISGIFWKDFRDFLGRLQGYSGHISSVLTIMEIDD